ncbi:hypothetical protein AR438_15700 [Chryseobacterium aquaticum]|uniref:Uncharacterized protein n=1 Tax=Chryseobacterium aquaticum TaxID=452084 RepID=A0A0Q3K484_9FLAO|nr:hypothetical protein AR438_15700 [Chryseobacterium aquaticum]
MKRESCENHELSRNCRVTEVFIKNPLCKKTVWEGNRDVTSQETCHFFQTKNFRDLKFVDLIVFSEILFLICLFVSIYFIFAINNEI